MNKLQCQMVPNFLVINCLFFYYGSKFSGANLSAVPIQCQNGRVPNVYVSHFVGIIEDGTDIKFIFREMHDSTPYFLWQKLPANRNLAKMFFKSWLWHQMTFQVSSIFRGFQRIGAYHFDCWADDDDI